MPKSYVTVNRFSYNFKTDKKVDISCLCQWRKVIINVGKNGFKPAIDKMMIAARWNQKENTFINFGTFHNQFVWIRFLQSLKFILYWETKCSRDIQQQAQPANCVFLFQSFVQVKCCRLCFVLNWKYLVSISCKIIEWKKINWI